MKKIRGRYKLLLYGMSGLGMNMLNLIIGSYLCDALMIEGFVENTNNWTYMDKTLVVAGLWSIMITFGKILDGIIDIPFAGWTDHLKSKWGKRRPAILAGLIPTVIAYVLFLIPLQSKEHSIVNTIWFGFLLCVFYAFYTLTMVTYYATFSEIVDNDNDRVTLSNVKTVFDVIYYVLGYALIPAFVGSMNIRVIALIFLPFSLTMLIPLFMIKERSTLEEDVVAYSKEDDYEPEETVGIWDSLKYAIKNKSFIVWMGVYFTLQFSTQLFLNGQNVIYSGYVQLEGIEITLVMGCAFAPVPLTLILYNSLVKKHGIRTGYIYSLLSYMAAMVVLIFSSKELIPNDTARIIFACLGGFLSSFGTGCFFSINYTIPSTLAIIEKKETGISHPAMYFAIQGLAGAIATALSTGLIWVNLKDYNAVWFTPFVVISGSIASLILTKFMSKQVSNIGKTQPHEEI